jgi:hypothetical protein
MNYIYNEFCMSNRNSSIVIAVRPPNSKCGFRVSSQCYFMLFKKNEAFITFGDFFFSRSAYFHTHTHTHTHKKDPFINLLKDKINSDF